MVKFRDWRPYTSPCVTAGAEQVENSAIIFLKRNSGRFAGGVRLIRTYCYRRDPGLGIARVRVFAPLADSLKKSNDATTTLTQGDCAVPCTATQGLPTENS